MRYRTDVTILLIIAVVDLASSCHSSHILAAQRARARAAKSSPRSNGPIGTSDDIPSSLEGIPALTSEYSLVDQCTGINYVPYNAIEMRSTAAVSFFPDEAPLTISDGGRITCSFDDQQEYCSWYNQPLGPLRFWKARYEIPFDLQRFECTSKRKFGFENFFLMAGGEHTFGSQKVAIETDIQCQFETALIKFDYWSNSENPILRQCIFRSNGQLDMECQDILPMANPVNFSIPQSMDPFKVRIEVVNIGSSDIVLIDNLYYEGRICEVVPDDEPVSEVLTTTSSLSSAEKVESEQWFLGSQGSSFSSFSHAAPTFEGNPLPQPTTTPPPSPPEQNFFTDSETEAPATSELSVCDALSCDFNSQHSCYFGLSGIGSTSPWLAAHELIGNRHTGIQRVNLNDASQVGFAYVGADKIDYSQDIFVMESPKFTLDRNIYLMFDIYLRSKGPTLRVCLDSFDFCPYHSPRLNPRLFWFEKQRIFIAPEVKKVYFIAENVGKNLFLAIDNVRIEAEDGSDPCTELH